jgi:hypothetical protein
MRLSSPGASAWRRAAAEAGTCREKNRDCFQVSGTQIAHVAEWIFWSSCVRGITDSNLFTNDDNIAAPRTGKHATERAKQRPQVILY